MTKKQPVIRWAMLAAFLAGCAASGAVLAVGETEPNDTVTTAQHLVIGPDGSVTVNGVMGVLSGTPVGDVDFYSFEGKEGDIVTIDIDNALAADNATGVDTIVALFGPGPTYQLLDQNDDAGFPLDTGSLSGWDSRIDNFRLPATGTYTVGVSSNLRSFIDAFTIAAAPIDTLSDGSYTLIISGVTPPAPMVAAPPPPPPAPTVQYINIDIKPGSTEVAPINPKAKGSIPVALLSNADFDALRVDVSSLRFGAKGTEASLVRCNKDGTDVNGDGRPDLVCHFDSQTAKFQVGDSEGIVTGTSGTGRQFQGKGWLKVLSGKRR
jgi:Bacterial pre-peptidase C-terminal domain